MDSSAPNTNVLHASEQYLRAWNGIADMPQTELLIGKKSPQLCCDWVKTIY